MVYVIVALMFFCLGLKAGDLKNYIADVKLNKKLDAQMKQREYRFLAKQRNVFEEDEDFD